MASCFASPRGTGLLFAGMLVGGAVAGAVGNFLGTAAGHLAGGMSDIATNLATPDANQRGRLLTSVFPDGNIALALSPSYLHLLDARGARATSYRTRVPAQFLHSARWVKTSTVYRRLELIMVDGSAITLELPHPKGSRDFADHFNAVSSSCRGDDRSEWSARDR